jgi:hypothetical protein
VQLEFERAVQDKNARVTEIKRIEVDIVSKDLEIKKIEETLIQCKQRKAFLDELAVSAGKKQKWVPGGSGKTAEVR